MTSCLRCLPVVDEFLPTQFHNHLSQEKGKKYLFHSLFNVEESCCLQSVSYLLKALFWGQYDVFINYMKFDY